MDTRDGTIVDMEIYKKYIKETDQGLFFKKMKLQPTEQQLTRRPPKVGRNDPCPCGSGKKFKKCCLGSIK